jgi:hypothetical protein
MDREHRDHHGGALGIDTPFSSVSCSARRPVIGIAGRNRNDSVMTAST